VAFLALISIELRFPGGSDLKGKRKQLQSVKAQLQRRFGASVAETDHHDLWQRARLEAAVVARDRAGAAERAAALERFVVARHPDQSDVSTALLSTSDVLES
jgi:uncharacterized protein YlxP (DUF503 family)